MAQNEQGVVRVCHVAVADLWAGAEVQLKVLLSKLVVMGFSQSSTAGSRKNPPRSAIFIFSEFVLEKAYYDAEWAWDDVLE